VGARTIDRTDFAKEEKVIKFISSPGRVSYSLARSHATRESQSQHINFHLTTFPRSAHRSFALSLMSFSTRPELKQINMTESNVCAWKPLALVQEINHEKMFPLSGAWL
jgi:hypothetical protein